MAASSILLYLLKANGALLLVAAAYFGLLRRLTFFGLNRAYLLLGLLFAAVYPALPMPALLPAEATPAVAYTVIESAGPAGAAAAPAAPPTDWAAVGLAVYGVGAAVLLARLLLQLLALARLRRLSRPARVLGVPVRALPGEVGPFSFGRSIYLNPEQHAGPELAAVLRHEQVHVRQAHTLDVLLAQLAQAAAWCNPVAWLLRRALLDNLEYLADAAVLETGLDRRTYQYSLLRLSTAAAGPALVSHFTFPTLKNRVIMMNMPLSPSGQLARYFVAGPLVLAVALGISGARAQGAGPVVPAAAAGATPTTTAQMPGQRNASPALAVAPARASVAVRAAAHPLPAGISAYITRTYPGSTIGGYFVAERPADKAPHIQYYASVTERNGERHKLYFNAAEQPVAGPVSASKPASAAGQPQSQPTPVVYLDGQRYTGNINDIGPENIANISVYKGAQATQRFGIDAPDGVLVVTTKAHEHDADVLAFNQKAAGEASKPVTPTPATAPASVPYLAAPALAYITQHYPAARLLGVAEVPAPNGGPAHYQAEIVIGRRPAYLLFDAAGQFISESFNRSGR